MMTECIAGMLSVAVTFLHCDCVAAHEACYSVIHEDLSICLYPKSAAICEQTMRLCGEAQEQLQRIAACNE